jgi:hypothetical protein
MNYSNHEELSKSLKVTTNHYGQVVEKDVLRSTSRVVRRISKSIEDQDERERLEYDIDKGLVMGNYAFADYSGDTYE